MRGASTGGTVNAGLKLTHLTVESPE